MGQVYLTEKIDKKLTDIAGQNEVTKEGLGNILLILSLCDEKQVGLAVNLIKAWGLGGATKLESLTL